MKKQSVFNKVLMVALVLSLALVAVMPIFAAAEPSEAPKYSITIENNPKLPPMVAGQFTAYQIFKGVLNTNATDPGAGNTPSPDTQQLADIEWGEDVKDGTELLKALKEASKEKYPEFYPAEAEGAETKNVFADCNSAYEVAKVIAGDNLKNDNAFLQAFAKLIATKEAAAESETTYKYLKEGTNSVLNPAEATGDPETTAQDSVMDVTKKGPGYYLVVDNSNHDDDPDNVAVSEFILRVVGEQTVAVKADVPTVDKSIIGGFHGNNGDVAGIGDTVKFRLQGTLPSNFATYDTYEYIFHDTLSKGLTFKTGSVKVYVQVNASDTDNELVLIPESYGSEAENKKNYTISSEESDVGTKLTITFDDLKKLVDSENKLLNKINAGSKIIVTYDATLNSDAVLGNPETGANKNDVYIEYSNNPNEEGTGHTPKDTVYVYTFGLDIIKVGSDKPNDGLKGAEFVLYRMVENPEYDGDNVEENPASIASYAKFEKAEGKNEWTLKEWTTDAYTGGDSQSDYVINTDNDGKFIIKGLDEGTYWLKEVKTPNGYNTMDDYKFSIFASIDSDGNLTSVTYTDYADYSEYPEGSYEHQHVYDAETTTEGQEAGHVFHVGLLPDTLVNIQAPFLPFTGGIGTVIFYVLGGILLIGGVAFIAVSLGKNRKAENN